MKAKPEHLGSAPGSESPTPLGESVNTTSSTSQTVPPIKWHHEPRKRGPRERLARWYMGRVAGRYCPCEWPIKVRWLIRICGRIDDAVCRYDFHAFAHFYVQSYSERRSSRDRSDTE